MAGSANPTNQVPLLKRLWGNNVAEPLYQRSKFLASIKKDTDFGSEGRYVNVTIAPTSGGSSDFGEALANMGATTEKRFFVTRRKEYQLFQIDGELIAASRGNKNAILEAYKQQADKARYAFFRALTKRAFGNGGGALGQVSSGSTVSSTTITLANTSDVAGFEVGMFVTAASDDGSSATPAGTRNSGAKQQITSINRNTGTLTGSVAWSTAIPSIATSDYLHRAGDYSKAATGIRGWCPVSDPSSSENFFGLDRTVSDMQRLSGIRVSGSSASKEEILVDASALAQQAGAKTNPSCVMNPKDMAKLVKELGSKAVYDMKSTREANIGFKALMLNSTNGDMSVYSEPDCPEGYAWIHDADDITMRSAGDCPMMLNEDGVGRLLRSATDDAYQGRLGAYLNFTVDNPGQVVIITW